MNCSQVVPLVDGRPTGRLATGSPSVSTAAAGAFLDFLGAEVAADGSLGLFAIADCCSTSATALLGATRWPARKACPSCVGSPVTGLHTLMQLCGQPNLAPLLRSGHGRLHAPSARRLRDGHVLKELVCVCSFIARERTCAAGSRACELNDDDVLRACNTMAWPLVSRAGGPVRGVCRVLVRLAGAGGLAAPYVVAGGLALGCRDGGPGLGGRGPSWIRACPRPVGPRCVRSGCLERVCPGVGCHGTRRMSWDCREPCVSRCKDL